MEAMVLYIEKRRKKMNFQDREIYFRYKITDQGIVIGISGENTQKVEMGAPIIMYKEPIMREFMQLDSDTRASVATIMRNIEIEPKDIEAYYFDALLDFVADFQRISMIDIAKEIRKMNCYKSKSHNDAIKCIVDNMGKWREQESGVLRSTGREVVKNVCHLCKIEESFLKKGMGKMYIVTNPEKEIRYNMESIECYIEKYGETDLKEMLLEITGADEDEILEMSVQCAIKIKRLPEEILQRCTKGT